MTDKLSVVVWLWSERTGPPHRYKGLHDYGVEDVRLLATGIHRWLAASHEVVVVTDWPAEAFVGIDCRVVDLRAQFGELRRLGGCWCRLRAFAADMADTLGARCAWIDLDSIVVGQLDPLFVRPEPLVLLKLDSVPGTTWNGSCALWSPRETDWLWRGFDPAATPQQAREAGHKGTDQSYLSLACPELRTPHWTYADGILHYSLHVGRRLPETARIVTWPGRLKATHPSVLRRARWLPGHLGEATDPALPVHLKPWPTGVEMPMRLRMPAGRRTLQDVRRERKLMAKAAERTTVDR